MLDNHFLRLGGEGGATALPLPSENGVRACVRGGVNGSPAAVASTCESSFWNLVTTWLKIAEGIC